MKKYGAVLAVVTGCLMGNIAQADNQTVSIGYAQSKVQDFKNIRGVNVQYRYEWNSPISVLSSFTYMKGSDDYDANAGLDIIKDDIDLKYYSLLVGPAYRVNDYISLYALGGIAHTKASGSSEWYNHEAGSYHYMGKQSVSETSNSFAYGFGFSVNPTDYLAVNVGYEGSKAELDGNHSINGFNVGVGFRF
ncbi:Ail/Lom family outer membrane beta-barrel protein [Providencia rettgeri]